MVAKGRQAWDMSSDQITDRMKENYWEFCIGLTEEMIAFRDETSVNHLAEASLQNNVTMILAGQTSRDFPAEN